MRKKIRSLPILILSLFALLLNSCNFDYKLIRGNGNIAIREIDVEDFSEITIGGNFKVELIPSASPMVIIETDENLMEHIHVQANNNQLEINSKHTLHPSHSLLVEVHYVELSNLKSTGASSISHPLALNADQLQVDLTGAGSIKLNLEVKELELNLSGAGLLETKGQVDRQVIQLSGAGNLNARDLESQFCEITISGLGNAEILAVQELNASITGLGNIEYYGSPGTITQNVSGLGNIKSKNR